MDGTGEFFTKLVDAFLHKSPDDLRQLREAVAAGDSEAVRRAAHGFKSSCANMGATKLAELCKELEQAGRAADLSRNETLLTAVEAEFELAQAALTEKQTGCVNI